MKTCKINPNLCIGLTINAKIRLRVIGDQSPQFWKNIKAKRNDRHLENTSFLKNVQANQNNVKLNHNCTADKNLQLRLIRF